LLCALRGPALDNDTKLYRELNESTATDRWLEGFDPNIKRVLIEDGERRDYWSTAASFFHGAESLREIVLEKSGCDLFQREYAMMFLYRHSVELFLKQAIHQKVAGHNLEQLLNKLVIQIKDEYKEDISSGWFAAEIRELSKIDPTAQGFRYPEDRRGNPPLTSSFFMDLEDLGKRMKSLYSVFFNMRVASGGFASNTKST
jgi:hypothetical protein